MLPGDFWTSFDTEIRNFLENIHRMVHNITKFCRPFRIKHKSYADFKSLNYLAFETLGQWAKQAKILSISSVLGWKWTDSSSHNASCIMETILSSHPLNDIFCILSKRPQLISVLYYLLTNLCWLVQVLMSPRSPWGFLLFSSHSTEE